MARLPLLQRDYQGSQAIRFDYAYDTTFPEKVVAITPRKPSNNTINPDWQAWQYDYYPAGSAAPGALFHIYRVRSDGGLDTLATYTYNSAGQVVTVTDGSGGVTGYSYHPATGDLIAVTYPKNSDGGPNPMYQYGRDTLGRVISVTDPQGNITSYTYDALDRILSVTLPKPSVGSSLNFVTSYSYDNYDSLTDLVFTHQTDPNGKLTKQGFDPFGQLVKSIDASGNITTFIYTKGVLTSITDANGNLTAYGYNGLKQLTSTTFPDGTTETYTYKPDGLLSSKKDRKNNTISFNYERLKRLATKTYPSGSTFYTYQGQKIMNVAWALNGDPSQSFTYDPSYRIASNVQGTRGTISYTYDAADRTASYSIDGGPSATYTYYDDGSLRAIQWSPVSGQFTFNYTSTGQYSSIAFPNGQSRNYTYDDQGRLTQLANTHAVTGNLATYSYGYDVDNATQLQTMLGQRSSVTADVPGQSFLGSSITYSYDTNYQLTQTNYPAVAPFNGEVDSWAYDLIGNRITSTVNGVTANYSYFKNGSNPNNGQRLQSDAAYTYMYDANGNMITKTGSEGTYTFTWNYDDRLTGLTGPGITASYNYDFQGRRSVKSVSGATSSYLYDGQNLIRETGASPADWLFGPGIDEPLAMSRASQTYYFNVDGLGSVTLLNDNSGAVQDSYVTDAWGVMRSQNETVANPFTYTAREAAEAGLMYYRARYYQPNIGRFVSEDPIGIDSGQMSLFTYVANSPLNFKDPYGLKVVNLTHCVIYVKEENNGNTHAIAPGASWDFDQDGFTSPCLKPCEVFKSCDNVDVTVHENGQVTTKGGGLRGLGCQLWKGNDGGGWKSESWLHWLHDNKDKEWDEVFDRSGMAHKDMCKCLNHR